jgi:uncharacterized protein (DUF1800 family)
MESFQGAVSVLLSLSLLNPFVVCAAQAPAANHSGQPQRSSYASAQLQGDARILHALNRFTFGPRPGDLQVVRSIGLDQWFEQQLHPDAIDLSDLNQRLDQYPAIQLSTADLLYNLPSNALIRQSISGRFKVPTDEPLHAIYQNQMDRVSARLQAQRQQPEPTQSTAQANTPAMGTGEEASPNPNPMNRASATPDLTAGVRDGATPGSPAADTLLVQDILGLQPQQRVARLISMRQPELDSFLKSLRPKERADLVAGLSPRQVEIVSALENPEKTVIDELIAARLTRDIYSSAQLQEVMTDFWLNHFNIYLHKNEVMPYYLVSFERDVIRPLALGKFENLLEATAHSPAMLLYLDNAISIGPHSLAAERAQRNAWRRPSKQPKAPEGLNENYARELMELHTLGVNGGYSQADVIQVARILTGWGVDQPQRGGGFAFNPNRHEPGTEKVMGQKFKDQGEAQGRALLHFLATRPATARFLSRELAIRFVSDNPPQTLIDRMAQTYMTSDGDIAAVLTTLYHSPEFWSASNESAKVKTPIEYVVSALRASDASVENLRPIANALRQMGMPLYGCIPPSGYGWTASDWVGTSSLVDRMNFALALAANRLPGIYADWTPHPEDGPVTASTQSSDPIVNEEARLEKMIVPGGLDAPTRTALLQQFHQQTAQNSPGAEVLASRPGINPRRAANVLERDDQILAGLLIGSPAFQRR